MAFNKITLIAILSAVSQISCATESKAIIEYSEAKKATEVSLSKSTVETLKIGKMVQKLQVAIKSPTDPKSLDTIYLYGTDTRYYSMIRGWLFQELVGVESQLHVHKSGKLNVKFQQHSDFLKKAIRSIDLE